MIDICIRLHYYYYTIATYDRYLYTYCIITITLLLYMINICIRLHYYYYTIAIYDRYLYTYCIITITLLLYMIDICIIVLLPL